MRNVKLVGWAVITFHKPASDRASYCDVEMKWLAFVRKQIINERQQPRQLCYISGLGIRA